MKLASAYIEIAERSVVAAQHMQTGGIHEACAFHSYHAFESAGGALVSHGGQVVPLSHASKIIVFAQRAKQLGIGREVAEVAVILGSIRNECLYPAQIASGYGTPSTLILPASATDMAKRAAGIVKRVKKLL